MIDIVPSTQALGVLSSTFVGGVILTSGVRRALAPSSAISALRRIGVNHWEYLLATLWSGTVLQCIFGATVAARILPDAPLRLAASADLLLLPALFIAFGAIAAFGLRHYIHYGLDWLDRTPARVGDSWNPNWLSGWTRHARGNAQLVVLMKSDFPRCAAWVKPLNELAHRSGMPEVIAGMPASPDRIAQIVRERGIEFPVLSLESDSIAPLADGFPTMLWLEGGKVLHKSRGWLPEELAA